MTRPSPLAASRPADAYLPAASRPAGAYLPAPTRECPTFVDDSEWHPLVDGASYLPALAQLMRTAGPGDAVIIVGLELDPDLDLDGHPPDDPRHRPLGEVLARLVLDGVDVHVVLANRVWASSVPGPLFGGFRGTAIRAQALRRVRPANVPDDAPAPLADRVLLDFSGATLGSNHQKAVVVRIGSEVTAFVGGIDLTDDRFDRPPHDVLRLDGQRWGWHDMAVRIRGAAARQVWQALHTRWVEASTLPRVRFVRYPWRFDLVNPRRLAAPPLAEPPTSTSTSTSTSPSSTAPPTSPRATAPLDSAGTSVRVLRSVHTRKLDPLPPWRRTPWSTQPSTGIHEVFETLRHAIDAATTYVYLEDQYLEESAGGDERFELYPALRAAAARGVRVVLVGSGTRDPQDAGIHLAPINRVLNPDIQRKIVDALPVDLRDNLAAFRVEHLTVHAKLVLVDDVFACIGSANIFSRSMVGTDCELSAAVATTTSLVRDLRIKVWAEHLRTLLTDEVRASLADLDVALGIWRPQWSTRDDPLLWRTPGRPAGFAPAEQVLRLVGP